MSVKIGLENYLKTDLFNALSVSSELAAFPASNLWNNKRRTKVWRSANHWTVSTGANEIVFNDGGGNFTAALTVGEYADDSSFLALIKAQMEAVGGGTYTVIKDTGNRIRISSSLGTFNILWTNVGSTAADLLGFNVGADDTGAVTYIADMTRLHTNEEFKWDFGIPTNPKGFFICDQRNTPMNLSSSAVIRLEGNETDIWNTPSYSASLTYRGDYIYVTGETGLHTEPLRYWRLYIEDRENHVSNLQIGAMYLGNMMAGDRGGVQFPLSTNHIDFTRSVTVESGAVIADVKAKTLGFSLSWAGLTIAEKELIDTAFGEFGTGLPWFLELDPDGVFSTNNGVYQVKYTAAPSNVLESPGNFSVGMSVREEL